VTLELSGLTAEYEQTGGSAMGRRGNVRFAQILLQLHDSLQVSSVLLSLIFCGHLRGLLLVCT
jgi:hypothetical protein